MSFIFTLPQLHVNDLIYGMSEYLLFLLENWAVASSTNFKLAWKHITLFALCIAKHCCDLNLLCIDNGHLFLQSHDVIFNLASCGERDQPGHLPPQIHIDLHSNVNLCSVFYLKAYICCIGPFRKKWDRSCVPSLFSGNNWQHISMCAKMISSLGKKGLRYFKVIFVCGYPQAGRWLGQSLCLS